MKDRNKSIYIRVSEKEKEKIKDNALLTDLSVSEFIRKVALGYRPKPRNRDNIFEIMNLLYEMYGDFESVLDEKNKKEFVEKIKRLEEFFLQTEKEKE